jgi:hypothetical protein
MAISYNLSVIGDCNLSGTGVITFSLIDGGTPPYTVQWTSPNLNYDTGSGTGFTSSRTNLSSRTYEILITDSSLPQNNFLNVSVPLSDGVCCYVSGVQHTTCGLNNGIVTGSSSSDFSNAIFTLYDNNDNPLQTETITSNNALFVNLSAGSYYMVVVDVGGCTGRSANFIIESSNSLDYGLYVVSDSSCDITPVGKIFVTGQTGTPPYTYLWSNSFTGDSITGISSGNYSVTVIDSNGCSKTTATFVDKVIPVNVISTTAIQPTCLSNNGSFTMLISGGTPPYYYSASTGDIQISYSNQYILNGLGGGFYFVEVTDAAFCKTSSSVVIVSPTGMSSVNVVVNNSSCSSTDGSILVNVEGGNSPYTYTLIYPDSSSKTTSTTQQNLQFTNLSTGTYTLFVSDYSGCTFSEEYSVLTNNTFLIYGLSTGATFGNNNGVVKITKTSGGTIPYTYSIDNTITDLINPSDESIFFNISPGQHTISVTDSLGCKKTAQIYVDNLPSVDFYLNAKSAGAGNDGEITAFISSGTPPFTFNWSDNVSGNPQSIKVTGLSGGSYSLTVTDTNNSTLQRTIDIAQVNVFSSYETYIVGQNDFQSNTNSKYSMLKMLNEGYEDLTLEHSGCNLNSANFIANIEVAPYGTQSATTFYTTNSLTNAPDDNLWLDTAKNLLMSITGIGDVIIDEVENTFIITSDVRNQYLVNGDISTLSIKLSLRIEYDIDCMI